METSKNKKPIVIIALILAAFVFVILLAFLMPSRDKGPNDNRSQDRASDSSNNYNRSNNYGSGPTFQAEDLPLPEMANPDLLILSSSLSDLPKDLAQVSLLKHFLQDSLLFHYEESETWLNLAGLFRRVAYENQLDLDEKFLHYALDSKAQIALWKTKGGQLKQYMVILQQDTLLGAMTDILSKISSDQQIKENGSLEYNGETVTRYKLQYGDKVAFMALTEGEIFLFSNQKMQLPEQKWQEDQAQKVAPPQSSGENETPKGGFFAGLFGLAEKPEKHHLVLSSEYMLVGYHRLIPAVQSLRYSFGEQGWKLHLLAGGEYSSAVNDPLQKQIDTLVQGSESAEASTLASPATDTATATIEKPEDKAKTTVTAAETATSTAIRTRNSAILAVKGTPPPHKIWAALPDEPALCLSTTWDSRPILPILLGNHPDSHVAHLLSIQKRLGKQVAACWYEKAGIFQPIFITTITSIDSDDGFLEEIFGALTKDKELQQSGDTIGITVWSSPNSTFAHAKGLLVFSPDKALVLTAIDSLKLKMPALGDRFQSKADSVMAVVHPKHLGKMLSNAADQTLRRGSEQLHKDFNQLIRPGLESMGTEKAFYLTGPSAGIATGQARWEEVQFNQF